MLNSNRMYKIRCDYKDCHNNAIYEFTDAILTNKKEFKTITIGRSCDDHYIKIKGERDNDV